MEINISTDVHVTMKRVWSRRKQRKVRGNKLHPSSFKNRVKAASFSE